MSSIQGWAVSLALAAVCGTVLELISPSGTMEKMVRFVLGAFMICALIVPVAENAGKISFEFQSETPREEALSEFKEQTENQALALAAENITFLAGQVLENNRITPQKIEVIMDTSDKGNISFIRLYVRLSAEDEERKQEVKELLEKELGLETEIQIGQE